MRSKPDDVSTKSGLLAEHLHYEVTLMRGAYDNLKRYTLSKEADRLKLQIAANRFDHSIVSKVMRGL